MTNQERFIIARWAYSIGEEFISDVEYDRLERQMKEEHLLPEYTNRVWSLDMCPKDLLIKYNLNHMITKVLFTDASESIPSINSNEQLKDALFNLNEESRISYKLDGFNIVASYYEGRLVDVRTRGRSSNSKDASTLASVLPNTIGIKGRVRVTSEFFIPNSKFESYCEFRGVKSQRNSVATAIANGDTEYIDYRSFAITGECVDKTVDNYVVLNLEGFKTPEFCKADNFQSLITMIDYMSDLAQSYDCPSDGLVIENSEVQYAIRLGAWEEKEHVSTVTGYTSNRGIHMDSLLVEIEPLTMDGQTITKIPVTNIETIKECNLRVGNKIAITKRSSTTWVIDKEKTVEVQGVDYYV